MTGTVRTKSGAETEYIKFGTGNRTLVILPGLSIQSVIPLAAAVETQYEMFKKDFTVYLFDRVKELPQSYSVYDMARDTAETIEALGLSGVCVFGASQGGMIALALAAEYPVLVSCIAVASSACFVGDGRRGVIDEWIRLAESGDAEKLCLSFGERVYPKATFEQFKGAFSKMAKGVTPNDLKRFVTLAKGIDGFDVREKVGSIGCPVLATGDADDGVLGGEALGEIERCFAGRDNFRLHLYRGFGHAVYDTAPDHMHRLFDFFKSV